MNISAFRNIFYQIWVWLAAWISLAGAVIAIDGVEEWLAAWISLAAIATDEVEEWLGLFGSFSSSIIIGKGGNPIQVIIA